MSSVRFPPEKLVIATRQSVLALWQAEHVRDRLRVLYPSCRVDLLGLTTQGDRRLETPLADIGGKGLFIKELETALEEHRADIAVHSMKDVPSDVPSGFAIAAVLKRADPHDALITTQPGRLETFPRERGWGHRA